MPSQVKIRVPTDAEDWHGLTGERLWATGLGGDRYRIDNVPLYAYGLSYGDIVTARSDGDLLTFTGVVGQGGNSTYRVLLRPGHGRPDFERYWARLEPLGCFYESTSDPENVFAISVPADADVALVYRILEEGAAEGIWHFDEGNFEHHSSNAPTH